MEEGCPDVGGARVRGRGWTEGGTPGEAGENKKTSRLFNLGEKWKKAEKRWKQRFLYTPKSDVRGEELNIAEKGIPDTVFYTPKSGVLEPF